MSSEEWVVELILAIDRIRDNWDHLTSRQYGDLTSAITAAGELADEAAQEFTIPQRMTVTGNNGS